MSTIYEQQQNSNTRSKEPHYLVIEGTHYSGKSTLMSALVAALVKNGISETRIVVFDFPTKITPAGRLLRAIFSGAELSPPPASLVYLFLADLAQVEVIIKDALSAGDYVICGRHPFVSGLVYQTDELSYGQITNMQRDPSYALGEASLLTQPDRVYVLDLLPSEQQARAIRRAEVHNAQFEQVNLQQQHKYRTRYVDYAHYNASMSLLLDASLPVEDTLDIVLTDILHGGGK